MPYVIQHQDIYKITTMLHDSPSLSHRCFGLFYASWLVANLR